MPREKKELAELNTLKLRKVEIRLDRHDESRQTDGKQGTA